jgi:hypothetical protein
MRRLLLQRLRRLWLRRLWRLLGNLLDMDTFVALELLGSVYTSG